ncbi:MAG: hypothetical protein QXI12_13385 [Candidatus Methanomethyliaceae archaeon]
MGYETEINGKKVKVVGLRNLLDSLDQEAADLILSWSEGLTG